jgi:hypothetical protein
MTGVVGMGVTGVSGLGVVVNGGLGVGGAAGVSGAPVRGVSGVGSGRGASAVQRRRGWIAAGSGSVAEAEA